MLNKALHIRKYQLEKLEKGGEDEEDTKKEIAKVTNKIGCVYFKWGDSRTAKDVFEDSLRFQREILDASNHKLPASEMLTLASTSSNIGKLRIFKVHHLC